MYCEKCGGIIPENATNCPKCNAAVEDAPINAEPVNDIPFAQTVEPAEKISTYLPFAIFTTICCCVPLGIVAIVYAAKTSALLAAGNFAGARETSRKAKKWVWIAFGCGILVGLIQVVIQILAVTAGALAE
ncbi:MAG: CD225/dispanin family protein [Lentisphaerae bacterium]|nr:CD225/dispanin family protein [Lentisphaerota bacterium]